MLYIVFEFTKIICTNYFKHLYPSASITTHPLTHHNKNNVIEKTHGSIVHIQKKASNTIDELYSTWMLNNFSIADEEVKILKHFFYENKLPEWDSHLQIKKILFLTPFGKSEIRIQKEKKLNWNFRKRTGKHIRKVEFCIEMICFTISISIEKLMLLLFWIIFCQSS